MTLGLSTGENTGSWSKVEVWLLGDTGTFILCDKLGSNLLYTQRVHLHSTFLMGKNTSSLVTTDFFGGKWDKEEDVKSQILLIKL